MRFPLLELGIIFSLIKESQQNVYKYNNIYKIYAYYTYQYCMLIHYQKNKNKNSIWYILTLYYTITTIYYNDLAFILPMIYLVLTN